jgi:AsmA protein
MKKVFKIVTRVVVLFVSVVVLAFGALYLFADPNKLKPTISSEVQKRTGYLLAFDGDLSWSLYPQLGVKAAHVTLTAPNQQKPFLDLRRINIAVEPFQLLRGVSKVRGEVHITEVTFMNVHASSALVGLHWQDNAIMLRPIQASLYGGSLSGFAHGKDFSKTPAWNWDVTLSHIDMQPFLRDTNGDNSRLKIAGTGQIKIAASTQGITLKQMLGNVNGASDFNLINGTVSGIDLNYMLKTADAILNKKSIELPDSLNQTTFDNLTGSVLINNGLAQTNNLLMTSSVFKVKGQGSYNLPAETLDLALQVASQQDLKSQWEVPVLVRGEIARPDIQLDLRELNKQIAMRELDNVKEKVRDQIKEHIPGKAGEYLQNLIGK